MIRTEFQALVTGALMGALMRAPEHGLMVDVAVEYDDHGNYLPSMVVTGRESLEQVRVTIEPHPKEEDDD